MKNICVCLLSEVVGDLEVTETMSTPSSSGASSGSSKSAEQFEAFWRQLKECHLNALEGMNANPLHFIFPRAYVFF